MSVLREHRTASVLWGCWGQFLGALICFSACTELLRSHCGVGWGVPAVQHRLAPRLRDTGELQKEFKINPNSVLELVAPKSSKCNALKFINPHKTKHNGSHLCRACGSCTGSWDWALPAVDVPEVLPQLPTSFL